MSKISRSNKRLNEDDWEDGTIRRRKKAAAASKKKRDAGKHHFKKAILEGSGRLDDDSVYYW